jgi:hypothetical protein
MKNKTSTMVGVEETDREEQNRYDHCIYQLNKLKWKL